MRTTVLSTPDALAHYASFSCANPRALAHLARTRAQENPAASGWDTPERNTLYPSPDSPAVLAQQAIADAWLAHDLIYDSARLHKLLDLRESLHAWRFRKGIPKLLSAAQVEWLGLLAVKAGNPRGHHLIDRNDPKHPFEPGAVPTRQVTSKIGKVYGTWRFTACLSDSENTSNNANVFYTGECVHCGLVHKRLNYRTVKVQRCRNCAVQSKRGVGAKYGLRETLRMWLLNDGSYMMVNATPPNAVAFIEVKDVGVKQQLTLLPGVLAANLNIVTETKVAPGTVVTPQPVAVIAAPPAEPAQASTDPTSDTSDVNPLALPSFDEERAKALRDQMLGDMPD